MDLLLLALCQISHDAPPKNCGCVVTHETSRGVVAPLVLVLSSINLQQQGPGLKNPDALNDLARSGCEVARFACCRSTPAVQDAPRMACAHDGVRYHHELYSPERGQTPTERVE